MSPRCHDAKITRYLTEAERGHAVVADELEKKHLTHAAKTQEDRVLRHLFVLQIVQRSLSAISAGSVPGDCSRCMRPCGLYPDPVPANKASGRIAIRYDKLFHQSHPKEGSVFVSSVTSQNPT